MSQFSMPYLVVNYGSEMIFILEQRLTAQAVRGEKSVKVLQDVSNALFSQSFLGELVRPQVLFSHATTREIFERLAHSSIMRLSESSMGKLYDLMTMGVKYQLTVCRVPRDLVRLTEAHLEGVRSSVKAADGSSNVDEAIRAVSDLSASLSDGQLQDVRHTLLNFFHNKRNKISLLMAEGLQTKSGQLVIRRGPIPSADALSSRPNVGTVQYYGSGNEPLRVETLSAHPDFGIEMKSVVDVKLGQNMYVSEKPKNADGSPSSTLSLAASSTGSAGSTHRSAPPPRVVDSAFRAAPVGKGHFAPSSQNSQAALSSLSNFIVQNAPKETLRIHNLFDEPSPSAASSAGGSSVDIIHIARLSREEHLRNNAELMGVRSSFDTLGPQKHQRNAPELSGGADGDDLLDLMDSAA